MTILQHFEQLPEPWRTQAIENYKFDEIEHVDSLAEAISCGFVWYNTKQGFDYWDKLHEAFKLTP